MSNKSKDLTAMRNARAWVELRHPGALLVEASKKIMWIPMKDGTRLPRTRAEDVWGVFDLLVFPMVPGCGIDLIQVTTITDGKLSAVKARHAKVGTWVRDTFPARQIPIWLGGIYVIGWVSRRHFRVWCWRWKKTDAHHWGGWVELEPEPVKAPKQAGSAPAVSEPSGDTPPCPFD